jgi:HAD superfamily hydrolase (TIGR01509 family)
VKQLFVNPSLPAITLSLPPKLVIFDCDGVLVDSELLANQVFLEKLTALGLKLSLANLFENFVGRSMSACMAQVEQMLGAPAPVGFLAELDAATFQAFESDLKAVPGIEQVLNALDAAAIPYCVASSGSHVKMDKTLRLTGLMPRLAGRIYSATEVARSKPFPDIYLYAASQMGVAPQDCVVIEDSPTGAEAGRAAGMKVFGYAVLNAESKLSAAGAKVFKDMGELPGLLGLNNCPPRASWGHHKT